MGVLWPETALGAAFVIFAVVAIFALRAGQGRREAILVRGALAAVVLGIPLGYPIARAWMRGPGAPPSAVVWSGGPHPVAWVVDEMAAGGDDPSDTLPRVTIVDLESGKPILLNGSFDEPALIGRAPGIFWVRDYTHTIAAFDPR